MKERARFLWGTLIIGIIFGLAGCPTDGGHDDGDPSAEELAGRLRGDLSKIGGGSATVNGATVTLASRVVIAGDLTVPASVTLDLTEEGELALRGAALTVNGTVNAGPQKVRLDDDANEGTINGSGTIQLKGQGQLLVVQGTKTLTLDGVTLAGVADNNEPLVGMSNGGALVMKSGAITDNSNIRDESANGGGVRVNGGGAFTMEGGAISGNTAQGDNWGGGGGVDVQRSAFTMKGGTISGNTAKSGGTSGSGGGGVQIARSTFTMEGGVISGNTAQASGWAGGGGVHADTYTTFIMKDGAISGNTAKGGRYGNGGGVWINEDSTFIMQGGAVSGNTTESSGWSEGGGVEVDKRGTFIMKGGAIFGNTAQAQGSGGGGVSIGSNDTFTMESGRIYGKFGNLPAGTDTSLANIAIDGHAALSVDQADGTVANWGTGFAGGQDP
jgi:hypothetical protein